MAPNWNTGVDLDRAGLCIWEVVSSGGLGRCVPDRGRPGQIESRNSAPAAVTVTLSMMSITGATSNSSHGKKLRGHVGEARRVVGLDDGVAALAVNSG